MVVAHKETGLEAVKQSILLVKLPVKRLGVAVVVPHAIKPDGIGVIILHKLCQLGVHELEIGGPVGLLGVLSCVASDTSGRIVVACPVDVGIIEVDSQPLATALIGEFAQHIAAEGGTIYYIIVRLLGGKHREAVMMARGEADVLGTGLLESRHPLLGIEARREESMGCLGIFVAVDAGIGHIPLSLAKHTVDAPMEEDAKAAFGESGTCLQIALGGLIGTRGIGSVGWY